MDISWVKYVPGTEIQNPRPSYPVHLTFSSDPSLRLSWPISDVPSWPQTTSQYPGEPLPGQVASNCFDKNKVKVGSHGFAYSPPLPTLTLF